MSGRDNKFPVTSGAMGRLMNKIKRTVSEAVSLIWMFYYVFIFNGANLHKQYKQEYHLNWFWNNIQFIQNFST